MLGHLISLLTSVSVVAAASIEPRASGSAWASTSDGRLQLSSIEAPVLGPGTSVPSGLSTWDFSIKEKSGKKQKVNGFGATVTDSTVAAFSKLSATNRAQVIKDLMSSSGINLSLMRHSIASSDLSADPAYSYDDNGGNPDPNLTNFNLGDRGNAMISLLAELKRTQSQMTLLGSPWAPPGWMQLDRKLTGGTANNNLDHQYEDAYANYFVKYLQAYEKAGVHVDAITIQNEPLNSRSDMPTLYIFADEAGKLIRDKIGPAIRKAGLNTQIWAYDHNTDRPDYPQTVSNLAGSYISAAAWHCYAGIEPQYWTPMTNYHNQYPNQLQYQTECWTAVGTTDWIHTANFNMMPLLNWGNGAMAWALGTYTGGGPTISGNDACHICTGLVTVNPSTGAYKKELDYYIMGQFSKFIPKGATVVDGTGSYLFNANEGAYMVATINPNGQRTVVIQNRYNKELYVRVKTESESQSWNARVPAKCVTSWVLPAA